MSALTEDYLIPPSTFASSLSSQSSHPSTPRVIPLCAAWFLPNSPHNGISVFKKSRIPGAKFLDIDELKDHHSPYPHMLPSADEFAIAMRQLGIKRDDRVVVYDSKELGLFSAPRVGWMFRVMGHERVNVLNSFKAWVAEGYPLETGPIRQEQVIGVAGEVSASSSDKDYPVPEIDLEKVANFEYVRDIAQPHVKSEQNSAAAATPQILDARPLGRFAGTDPEPRPGLSSGHIPGSISVPFPSLLDPTSGTLLPAQELRKIFEAKGVDLTRPVISSCGTGVTAAVVDAALEVAGYKEEGNSGMTKKQVYDGSWTEWAQRVKKGDGMIVKGEIG